MKYNYGGKASAMYYDPMPIDLMVCVCEGHLGGTLVFVRDIRRGGPGWGVEGEQQRCVDFSFFERYGRAGERKDEGGEGRKGMKE